MSKPKAKVEPRKVTLSLGELRDAVNIGMPLLMVMEPTPLARIGVRMAKVARVLKEESREFFEQSNELIKKYGEKNKKGVLEVAPDNPKHEEWQAEYKDLCEVKVEITVIPVMLASESQPKPMALFHLGEFVTVRGDDEEDADGESKKPPGPTEVVKPE